MNSGFHTNHREKASVADFAPSLQAALLSSEDTVSGGIQGWIPSASPVPCSSTSLAGRCWKGEAPDPTTRRSLYPNEVGEGDTLQRKWNELLVAPYGSALQQGRTLAELPQPWYLGVVGALKMQPRRISIDQSALTLPQAALLVGLLPSPNGHDPCRHPEAALSARNAVLNKMVREGRLG